MAENGCPNFRGLFTTKVIKSNVKPHMEPDAQKVNYVYLPLLPPRIKVKMAVIWMLNFLLLPFEGFIICLHLLKNAWWVQFRLLWRRIWAALFKNPPFLGGWGADKDWNVPKWSFQQISIILKLKPVLWIPNSKTAVLNWFAWDEPWYQAGSESIVFFETNYCTSTGSVNVSFQKTVGTYF